MEYLLFAGDPYDGTLGAENYCGRINSLDDANRIVMLMVKREESMSAHLARWVNDGLVIYYQWDDDKNQFVALKQGEATS